MFSYALGQENLLCDERHSAGSPSMVDFEKIFTSCGKVTSLSLSVNAISAPKFAHGHLFTLADLRWGGFMPPSFFRERNSTRPVSRNVQICGLNFDPNPNLQPKGFPLLLITDYG
jgi:hypothetical protein